MTGEYAEVEVLEEHRVIEVRVDGKEEDATREEKKATMLIIYLYNVFGLLTDLWVLFCFVTYISKTVL